MTTEPKEIEAESVETIDVEPTMKERLSSAENWLRLVFMILFGIILGVVGYVFCVLVILQFLWALFTGDSNAKLRNFGGNLTQYTYQMLRFLTYNSEEKPFPFADWPDEKEN